MPALSERLRVLVAITSYGNSNDRYLLQLIQEYRSMSFDVDLVILSNIPKPLASGIEVIVGLPTNDPWSLPFAHKQVLFERRDKYDLFVYSEDDVLITERNLRSFLEITAELPSDEIAGFFRVENGSNGQLNFPEIHGSFHWDPGSVRKRSKYTLAHFTNEHAACYVLTKPQLTSAIKSGGFLVEPHQGPYDLACSAATDPYTQCGFTKLIAISHLQDFTVPHLSNRYVGFSKETVGSFGVDESELNHQIDALMEIGGGSVRPYSLYETDIQIVASIKSQKNFYEPITDNVLSMIPGQSTNVLSIGCGSASTELMLSRNGHRVTALPLDSVVSRKAKTEGIAMIYGDFEQARSYLSTQTFDCLLCINILHYLRNPAQTIALFSELLSSNAVVVIRSPNDARLRLGKRKIPAPEGGAFASPRNVGRWCQTAGLVVNRISWKFPRRLERTAVFFPQFLKELLATEFVIVAGQKTFSHKTE